MDLVKMLDPFDTGAASEPDDGRVHHEIDDVPTVPLTPWQQLDSFAQDDVVGYLEGRIYQLEADDEFLREGLSKSTCRRLLAAFRTAVDLLKSQRDPSSEDPAKLFSDSEIPVLGDEE